MAGAKLTTSSVGRFVTLGGLAGRVGASVVGNQVLELVRSGPARQLRRTENLVRNAGRIAETLGELKGAAMKVGQMLSLHDGLLPPEVAEVLRSLQKEAPRVPVEVIEDEIRGSLENFDELFERLDFEAFAAASIGQVHLGVLRDGRPVAVKIQYPLIDEIVTADLANLRRVVHLLVAWCSISTSSRSGARCAIACSRSSTTPTKRRTCAAWRSSTVTSRSSSSRGSSPRRAPAAC